MEEFLVALKEGRIIESFGAGTAAIVSPIKLIHYNGTDYTIPIDIEDPTATIGKLSKRLSDTILGIQYGEIPHEWSLLVK